jgi:hypothetical protein
MLPSAREITFHSPISGLSLGNDKILHVIDNNFGLHKIDLDRLEITKSTTLSSHYKPELFDYYIRPFALGAQQAYISLSKNSAEYVIGTQAKLSKLSSFTFNTGATVSKAAFSQSDALMITGNEKGRSFLIQAREGSLIAELPRSKDAITAVTIYEESKLAAYASFSRKVLVYRYSSRTVIFEKNLPSVVEMLCFVNEKTLLAITRDGKLLKINLDRESVVHETLLDENLWPSYMHLSNSRKYVYIGTRESVLYAVHVKSMEILFSIKLPYLGITSFVRTSRYFIFGFKSGEVLFLSHREFEDQFILNIKLKKIKEASLLFHKNIFLMSHRDTRLIYDEWLLQKETIVNLLSFGNINEARTLAEPFLFHPKCKLEFTQIEELQPDLMALHRYFRSLSFPAAYELASSKPLVKKSAIYTQMEALWNKNLQKAQILLSRGPVLNKDAARDCLKLFADVEGKKILIEQMLTNSRVFMLSESAIKEKNFALYFKLVSHNTFLELTPLHKKVILLGEKLQSQIVELLEQKRYSDAISTSSLLFDFTPYRNQAKRLKEACNALIVLEHHIELNHLFEAIQTQEQHKLGTNYAPIQKLEEMKIAFQYHVIETINTKAFSNAYNMLVPYMSISICKTNVAYVLRKLYIAQFKNAFETCKTGINWEKSIGIYTHFFGTDTLLKEFIASHELELDEAKLEALPITQEPSLYPQDLLVLK